MIALTYDNFSLQSNGVYTTETDIYSSPNRTIQAENLAQTDGSVIVRAQYESKIFTCEGYMKSDTISGLDTLIDTFKKNMNKQNQFFDIDWSGSTRRYIATPRNIIISRDKGLNTAGWSVEFFCESPVGMDTASSTLIASTNVTNSSTTIGIDPSGSYQVEPVITVAVTTVTGATDQSITLSNDLTLRGITVTRTWTNGDSLEVNCLTKQVFVNDVEVDFTGQFPIFEPTLGGLTYLDTFTTRSVNITAEYTARYL